MDKNAYAALMSGRSAWNEYLRTLPSQRGADLSHAKLAGMVLPDMNFAETDLSYADLSDTFLTSSDFSGANLSKAKLNRAKIHDSDFSGAILSNVDFTEAAFNRVDFYYADLREANFSGASFQTIDFTGAGLEGVITRKIQVSDIIFDSRGVYGDDHGFMSLEKGVTRVKVNLPADVDPQVLLDCKNAVEVLNKLLSQVGSRIENPGPSSNLTGHFGNTLVATDSESVELKIRRVHYGSPLILDIVEYSPEILSSIVSVVAIADAIRQRKPSWRLWKGFQLLGLGQSVETRAEKHKTDLESQRAKTTAQLRKRRRNEVEIKRLDLEERQLDEQIRLLDEIQDPIIRRAFTEAATALMPLLEHGATVTRRKDSESSNEESL